jgi:hypothetical protein
VIKFCSDCANTRRGVLCVHERHKSARCEKCKILVGFEDNRKYVDYIDLSTMCCMISYVNAKNESRVYQVPFYDIYTYAAQGKILVPWCLDATVAATAGVVQFSIQFYRVGEIINSDGLAEKVLNYSLNTLPARSVVLEGMEVGEVDSSYLLTASQFQILSDAIQKIDALNDIYWTVLTE